MKPALEFNKLAKAWGIPIKESSYVSQSDASINQVQSDCILCGSCFSACPVYTVKQNFLGPFALTRAWKYACDVREQDISNVIGAVQTNGIYDCTLCNECVPVCPQGIAPKQDIVMLKNKSGVMGYLDPNFTSSFGGFDLSF
jgi:fumarate reductase iron-sulfur subunit